MPAHHPIVLHLARAGVGLTMLLGIAVCFFGYRLFRIVLGILGFAACGWVTYNAGLDVSGGNEFVALVAGGVGGIVGAVLFIALYYIGVFLLGALFVMTIVSRFLPALEPQWGLVVLVALAGAGGLLAVFVQRFVIIVSTAFTGSQLVVQGMLYFHLMGAAGHNPMVYPPPMAQVNWLPVFLLGLAGALVQFLVTGKPRTEPAPGAQRIEEKAATLRDE